MKTPDEIKAQWKPIGAWLAANAAVIGLVLAVLWIVLGEWREWKRGPGAPPAPVIAAPTERIAEAPRVVVEAPLVAPALPPKVVKRIAREYRKPGLATVEEDGSVVGADGHAIPGGISSAEVVLTEVELPPMPAGGGALVTREADGAIGVTVIPKPLPFVELRSEFAVGALIDPTGNGNWRGYARWTGLRIGRIHAVVEAGGESRSGSSGGYALLGAEFRFGGR